MIRAPPIVRVALVPVPDGDGWPRIRGLQVDVSSPQVPDESKGKGFGPSGAGVIYRAPWGVFDLASF